MKKMNPNTIFISVNRNFLNYFFNPSSTVKEIILEYCLYIQRQWSIFFLRSRVYRFEKLISIKGRFKLATALFRFQLVQAFFEKDSPKVSS